MDPSLLVKIGQAAKLLGTTPETLRRWERTGELLPTSKSAAGTRYYLPANLYRNQPSPELPTVAYARVSSSSRKDDLDRQRVSLQAICASNGWNATIIQDIGSGVDLDRKGFRELLNMILQKRIRRLVLTHVDRLLLSGTGVIFTICEEQGIEVVITNQSAKRSFERTLQNELTEVSSAKIAYHLAQAVLLLQNKSVAGNEDTDDVQLPLLN